jgi:SAM-dependent methyltransferase
MGAKKIVYNLFKTLGFGLIPIKVARFHSDDYLQHNARRLEHLSSLRIPVARMTVLEVGAGVGDHSHYYIDRDCRITITEARQDNLNYLRKRYPNQSVEYLDIENPGPLKGSPFDIVHCYGLLYHLGDPEKALSYLSSCCQRMLFLETRVFFGDTEKINVIEDEDKENPTQSLTGKGCRPTRPWLYRQLRKHFEYVYLPRTQPNHEDFPLDWTAPEKHEAVSRAIFIASREAIENELLTTDLIDHQVRHE